MERRAFPIALLLLRIRPDQPIEITRLKLVRVARQGGGIAHPVVTCAALKEIPKDQRPQRGVATGAAAADDDAPLVHQALRNEELGAVDTVVDIDDAPVAAQAVTIGAAESS